MGMKSLVLGPFELLFVALNRRKSVRLWDLPRNSRPRLDLCTRHDGKITRKMDGFLSGNGPGAPRYSTEGLLLPWGTFSQSKRVENVLNLWWWFWIGDLFQTRCEFHWENDRFLFVWIYCWVTFLLSTKVNPHQTTIWENMFNFFPSIFMQIQVWWSYSSFTSNIPGNSDTSRRS